MESLVYPRSSDDRFNPPCFTEADKNHSNFKTYTIQQKSYDKTEYQLSVTSNNLGLHNKSCCGCGSLIEGL